jgi:3-methyladenine DNA glycosylase AlkC
MPEPFKNLLDTRMVRDLGARLAAAEPAFPRARFDALALDGLAGLEMKARAMRIADALEATLPGDFDAAAAIVEAAIAAGLEGWALWPVGEFVARRGLATPERGLRVLHALTQRFTAEWAIRPFIVAHPRRVFATLQDWTRDPSAAVRRLVSEGSRPRLPWGLRLKSLIDDPSPTLPLLEALLDDESDSVRKSVANHLNDIAKDHPALVAEWVERHLPGAGRERRALLRHACRTLIKRGDARVLAAWGQGAPLRGEAALRITPRRLALGDSLTLEVTLQPRGRTAQSLVIDYAVHHVKASGGTSPKVFKGWSLELAPGPARLLRKSHPVRPITTRRYFSGTHRVELLVNGRVAAQAAFELRT